ncbi:acyltransferase domain-containing protein [Streptacidiphilus sp. 4-A2]|nr:acyltransferase domain-containing protein [Streptacidiphilus sp. 4-A2]
MSLAAVNGPSSVVVRVMWPGWRRCWSCGGGGRRVRRLRVSHAFHSALMDPVLDELGSFAAGLEFALPSVAWVGALAGEPVVRPEPGYWARQARQPVRFADTVAAMAAQGVTVFLEIGPDGTLSAMGPAALPTDNETTFIPLLRPNTPAPESVLTAFARAHVGGAAVDWSAVPVRTPTAAAHLCLCPPAVLGPLGAGRRRRGRGREQRGRTALLGRGRARRPGHRHRDAGRGREPSLRRGAARAVVLAAARAGRGGDRRLALPDLLGAAGRPGPGPPLRHLAGGRRGRREPERRVSVAAERTGRRAAAAPGRRRRARPGGAGHPDQRRAGRAGAEAGAPVAGVLSLLALDETPWADADPLPAGLAGTLALVQALGVAGIRAPLWVLTRAAVTTRADEPAADPAGPASGAWAAWSRWNTRTAGAV